MPLISQCRCGRKWSGTVSAHCSVCHEHFSTVRNFDLHEPGPRACKHPSTKTRTKKDGTVVPLLKPVKEAHGITWVSFTEDTRYASEGAA